MGEPEALVATLCHEVAHAWRHSHRLAVEDRAQEERLTDATTVYLGFGLLTTNGAYAYRSLGEVSGGYAITRWSHQRSGYLPPQAMSFLLAAQVLARKVGFWERRRLVSLLEPNQASFFRRAFRQLRQRSDLAKLLSTEPSPGSAERRLELVPTASEGPSGTFREFAGRFNAGRSVYRVKRSKALPYGFAGLVLGVAAGFGLWWLYGGAAGLFGAIGVGAFAGGVFGQRASSDHCSDPACATNLVRGAHECPRCGGALRGAIRGPDERLEREASDPESTSAR